MSVTLDISVESDRWDVLADRETLAERAIAAAVRESKAKLAKETEVSLLLCDDAAIRALNKTWLGNDKATNVLSFPNEGPEGAAAALLGDIVIGFETTSGEASEEGKSLGDHVSHLIVHGFLHLIGYEHESDAEAREMEGLERRVLASLGIADPYAGTEPIGEGR